MSDKRRHRRRFEVERIHRDGLTDRHAKAWIKFCEIHEKNSYGSRKAAKAEIRRLASTRGMREYRCRADRRYWHIGHMPVNVRKGLVTVGQVYGR